MGQLVQVYGMITIPETMLYDLLGEQFSMDKGEFGKW